MNLRERAKVSTMGSSARKPTGNFKKGEGREDENKGKPKRTQTR